MYIHVYISYMYMSFPVKYYMNWIVPPALVAPSHFVTTKRTLPTGTYLTYIIFLPAYVRSLPT